MGKQLFTKALTAVLPLALGFFGGISSTFFPAYFQAFCTGSLG